MIASPEALQRLREIKLRTDQLLAPPPVLKVSEWAESARVIPKGASARPGLWQTESYQREMMDAILELGVEEVVLMTSTQVGKSEVLNNICGYYMDADPKPILMVQPTDGTAKDYSKKRIAPMIEHSPALHRKVREPRSRTPGNTILLKEFDGGFLKLVGANTAAGLRSDPIAVLLTDEVDGYPDDVDGEGDPLEIATRRTDTFDDRKIVKASTPAKPKGLSRIEADFLRSDQRRYYVPCPFCNHYQPLCWRDPKTGVHRLTYQRDEQGNPLPESVRYVCAGCGQGIDEKFKQKMLDAGQWRAENPRSKIPGFHLNALYSPWRLLWSELALEWVEAHDNPEKLKTFVNLRLAETWNEGGESFNAHVLAARRETYSAPVPKEVGVLVAAADVQQNRIEAQVMGFGRGEESWLVAHEVFWGDPGRTGGDPDVWAQLDEFLLRQWKHEAGPHLMPAITLIDTGFQTDAVYNFVLPRQHTRRRIFACKGVEYLSKPLLVQEGTSKRAKVRLWIVATHAAKDRVFARMKIPAPGPGYLHLPDWITEEYLEQLTGEKKISVRHKRTRKTKYIYVKTYARNEALDRTVYCHAGLFVLQQFVAPSTYRDLGRLAENIQQGRMEIAVQRRVRRLNM